MSVLVEKGPANGPKLCQMIHFFRFHMPRETAGKSIGKYVAVKIFIKWL